MRLRFITWSFREARGRKKYKKDKKDMAHESVEVLDGIGPKTRSTLATYNIKTVGDLTQLSDGQIPVKNLASFISRAKAHVKHSTTTTPNLTETLLPLSVEQIGEQKTQEQKVLEQKVLEEKEKEQQKLVEEVEEGKYFLADHSWFEMRVLLPVQEPSESKVVEAIIHELTIEPKNRISFLCVWIKKHPEEDKLIDCRMTYSPQLLRHFNPTLPLLELSIRPEDLELLHNKHTLENVLWETNIMRYGK